MDKLADILAAIAIFNQSVPVATGLILTLRKEDGTETPLNTLDAAEAQVDANIAEAEAFLKRHQG